MRWLYQQIPNQTERNIMDRVAKLLAAVGVSMLCMFSNLAKSETTHVPGDFDIAMKSRTCGLVLLSEGRATVRAGNMESGMAELVSAFALLQDGRTLEDKTTARTASQKILSSSPATRATEISTCKHWLEQRKTQSNFSRTEVDQWNWVSQAQLTIQTEK
jgi:hypothetical protein